MWWLDSEKRTIPTTTQSLLPEQLKKPANEVQSAPQSKQPVVMRPAAKRPVGKCASPLIDTLTSEQEQANLILSQFQCGHEVEIERLLIDVCSLEKSIRQSMENAELQQATIEQKGFLLRLSEERAEALHISLAEFGSEVQRLDTELHSGLKTQLASQLQHQKRVEECEHAVNLSERRLVELAKSLHDQVELHRQDCSAHEQQRNSEAVAFRKQLAEHESELVQKNHEISELQQLNRQRDAQLDVVNRHAARWQLETQRSHASRKSLAEQMRRQKAEDKATLDQMEAELAVMRVQCSKSESALVQKDQEIGELMQLHDQLTESEKRAATWQLETQRSHASRRALAEQTRRQKAVDDEDLRESESQQKQFEQKHRVAQLRGLRLRAEKSLLEKQLQKEREGRIIDRRIRESETSKVQSLVQAKAIQVDQLRTSVEMRDREIFSLKDALTATQLEIGAAWYCSKEAANQLQIRDAELQRARDNEERFVQLQADQAETLQSRIELLVSELGSTQESWRIDAEGFERMLAELEGLVDQLSSDHGQMKLASNLAQQTNAVLLTEAAKSRAQLSGGRAKGTLLIERYERRLREALDTIETLRSRAQANVDESRRAA